MNDMNTETAQAEPLPRDRSALRQVIESASLASLTVLSKNVDPYRMDTEAGHRDGAWLAGHLNRLYGPSKKLHWRGLHYALVTAGDIAKPNGEIYRNTDADWSWLMIYPAKSARWLGYIPFERIKDQRNAPPIIHRRAKPWINASLLIGLDIDIPDVDDIEPTPIAHGFVSRQSYHFVIFGEKSSLDEDLYLPTGEISDTLIHQIAKEASEDGRPLVMFTLSDCDPAGHQMPISIARKLQAFRDMFFPELRFEVVPVALTPEQVRGQSLPSTPLKETEKRASRWKDAFGIEQTEIDALTTPEKVPVLQQMIEDAFKPYIDPTLFRRVQKAETDWRLAAHEAINRQIDADHIARIRDEASAKLDELRAQIEQINEKLEIIADDHFTLPPISVPQPNVALDPNRQALVSFDDDWVSGSRALIRHKSYE
jgi:hypothetical protein